MNLKQLQLVVALEEQRSLARVAEMLNVTSPAVSKALRDIERELDVELFRRGPRGVASTAYGQCIVRHARAVLAELTGAAAELKAMKDGTVGSVALGVLPAAAPLLAPLAIADLKKRAPLMSVLVREGTIDTLLPEMQLGRLDVIVGNLPIGRSSLSLACEVLHDDDPVAVVGRTGHPLTHRRKLTWEDLLRYPWVIPPSGSSMNKVLEAHLVRKRRQIAANCIESGSLISNKTLIQLTDTVGFFSKHIAEHFADQKQMAILKFESGLTLGPVGAIWRGDRALSPSVDSLLRSLRNAAREINPM